MAWVQYKDKFINADNVTMMFVRQTEIRYGVNVGKKCWTIGCELACYDAFNETVAVEDIGEYPTHAVALKVLDRLVSLVCKGNSCAIDLANVENAVLGYGWNDSAEVND